MEQDYDTAVTELAEAEAAFKTLRGQRVNISADDYAGLATHAAALAKAQQKVEGLRQYVDSIRGRAIQAKIEALTLTLETKRETKMRTEQDWRAAVEAYEENAKVATRMLSEKPGHADTIALCAEAQRLFGQIFPALYAAQVAEQDYLAVEREMSALVNQLKQVGSPDEKPSVFINNIDEFREAAKHIALVVCEKNDKKRGICGMANHGSGGFKYFVDPDRSDKRYVAAIDQYHFALANRDQRPEMYKILDTRLVPCQCKDCKRVENARRLQIA